MFKKIKKFLMNVLSESVEVKSYVFCDGYKDGKKVSTNMVRRTFLPSTCTGKDAFTSAPFTVRNPVFMVGVEHDYGCCEYADRTVLVTKSLKKAVSVFDGLATGDKYSDVWLKAYEGETCLKPSDGYPTNLGSKETFV